MTEPLPDERSSDERLAILLASVGQHLVIPDDPLSDGQPCNARLRTVLPSLGQHLVVPETAIAATPTVTAARWRRVGGPWLGVAAVALVALIVGVVVAPVRQAVADWLGVASTRIETSPADNHDTADLPGLRAGLSPMAPDEAVAALGRPLPEVGDPRLGEPTALATSPAEGGVVLAWERGSITLWVRADEPGLQPDRVKRGVGSSAIERIDDLGDGAVLVGGDHVLETPVRRVAATSTLLWTEDGLEYRLESDLDRDTMLAIARSIRP